MFMYVWPPVKRRLVSRRLVGIQSGTRVILGVNGRAT